jgi:hypothetical protein
MSYLLFCHCPNWLILTPELAEQYFSQLGLSTESRRPLEDGKLVRYYRLNTEDVVFAQPVAFGRSLEFAPNPFEPPDIDLKLSLEELYSAECQAIAKTVELSQIICQKLSSPTYRR